MYVLIEMRIPPENTGAAIVVTTTVGTMAASIAPFLSQTGFPATMIIIDAIVLLNILLTCFLSEPGAYLPSAVKVSESVTLVRLENDQVINDTVVHMISGCSMSFSRTFHELNYGVERPRLNQTSIDPDLCKPHDGNTSY